MIRLETLNYNMILTLLLGKIHKYEYLTGEEILPSDQKQMIEKLNLLILFYEELFKNK